MKPTKMFCVYDKATSSSPKLTKEFGWVGRATNAVHRNDKGNIKVISAPRSLSMEWSGMYYINHIQSRGKWFKIADEDFIIPRYDTADGKVWCDIPKTALKYCAGYEGFIYYADYGSERQFIRDGVSITVSKKFIESKRIISADTYQSHRDGYDELSFNEWDKESRESDAVCFCQYTNSYAYYKDSVHVPTIGFISKDALGAYAESMVRKYTEAQARILKSATDGSAKIKRVKTKIPQELLNQVKI